MPVTLKSLGIDAWSVEDRLMLMQEIWESLKVEQDRPYLTDEFKAELSRRSAEHDADPSLAVAWEEVKAEATRRLESKEW